MPKYYETKNFLVKTLGVAILMVITGLFSTSKVFADEPGSVFLWGGYAVSYTHLTLPTKA